MKYNAKQIAIIIGSLVLGFLVNWLLWLAIMRHPTEIGLIYHALVTVTLGVAFLQVGDVLFKGEIFT